MDHFKKSLVKISNESITTVQESDKVLNLSEQTSLLQGCYTAQLDAVDDLYHTSKNCLSSLRTAQSAEGVTLIPLMMRFPSPTKDMTLGIKMSYIRETLNQLVCIIGHFAEEATTIEHALKLTDTITSNTSLMNCDYEPLDLTAIQFDDSHYETITTSTTGKTEQPPLSKSEETITSPQPDLINSITSVEIKPRSVQHVKKTIPGSQQTKRGR